MHWDVISVIAGLLLCSLYLREGFFRKYDESDVLGNLGLAAVAGALGAMAVGFAVNGTAYLKLPGAMAGFVIAFWLMGVIYANQAGPCQPLCEEESDQDDYGAPLNPSEWVGG